MKSPPSKAALKREKQADEEAALDKKALDCWFRVSGTTMADLEAQIERYPSVVNGVQCPGLDPEVATVVFELRDQSAGISTATRRA